MVVIASLNELHLHFFQLELRNLPCSDLKGRDGITADLSRDFIG